MLRFCIDLIQSSSDRGWSPTVFSPEGIASPEGHHASVRGTRVPEATSGLGWLPTPLADPAGSGVDRFRLSQLSAVSVAVSALAVASRIGIASATVPPTGKAPCAPLARQVQPPSRPTITARDAIADLLWTSPAGIPSRLVQMNATMPDKLHVGSFVATTIGASQPNDNPFRAHRTR